MTNRRAAEVPVPHHPSLHTPPPPYPGKGGGGSELLINQCCTYQAEEDGYGPHHHRGEKSEQGQGAPELLIARVQLCFDQFRVIDQFIVIDQFSVALTRLRKGAIHPEQGQGVGPELPIARVIKYNFSCVLISLNAAYHRHGHHPPPPPPPPSM